MHSALSLALAIVAELIATSCLKLADGFTRPLPSAITVAGYAVAFYLLSLTLRRMDVGVAYAIWSGAGTALMALIGWWLFDESFSAAKLVSLGLIVAGVVGLHAGEWAATPLD